VLIDPTGTQAADPPREQQPPLGSDSKQLEENRKALEAKYKVTIEKGDKDWSLSDIGDLTWALSRLSDKEAATLKGYRFMRWQDRLSRQAVDPSYNRKGEEEAGLHEPNVAKNSFKISLYDKAFDKATTFQLEVGGKPVGEEQLVSRLSMLHEIGHALAFADYRSIWNQYSQASDAYGKLVEKHNSAQGREQRALAVEADKALKRLKALEKKHEAARFKDDATRAEREFGELARGMTPVTEYAGKNAIEGFAETFAMYKLNPKGIEMMNQNLADWLKKKRYLSE
jgi:hypothetical protein